VGAVVVLAGMAAGCAKGPLRPPAAEALVRPGTRPTVVRTGNIDSDPAREVVVASVSEPAGGTGIPAPYLEVFDHRGGRWRRVFDAHASAPPGPPGTPPRMLEGDEGFVAQSVHLVELVDFRGDRGAEIVVAIASSGATAGPVELWILAATNAPGLRTEFYEGTARGGEVTLEGDRIRFAFPVYRPDDPGCCPSRLETQSIGYDRASDRIGILERERAKL
jgi:hypothetical protein